MIAQQGPGEDGRAALLAARREAREQIVAVTVGAEDAAALNSPSHDVMQDLGTVEARGPGHDGVIAAVIG
jgi:hypothetical protein